MAVERFEAHIGAEIREFKRKMKEVDREVRQLASGVDVDLDLSTAEFYAEMKAVQRELKGLDNKDLRLQVELAYLEFKRQLAEVYMIAETLDDYEIDVEVDAIITDFRKKLLTAKALAQGLDQSHIDVELDLDTSRFNRAYLLTVARITALDAKEIKVYIKAKYRDFIQTMGRIATVMRNWGEIFQTHITGVLISLIPLLSPIIGSLVGLIGSLGVMIGVMAGQLLIMTGAISASAMAFAGLAAVAIPTIKAIFDETAQLTAAQQEAKNAWDSFVAVYDELVSKTEGAVLDAFTSAMQGATTILQSLEPMIISVADAAAELMDTFKQVVNTEPIQAIFDAFNQFSADIFTNMVEGIGHFIAAIGSMMAALLPAGLEWSETFNGMMEDFANWAAALGENQGFQNFIAFVQENMPLISQLFGDMIVGIVEFFSAFDQMGSDFINGLADMMESFREWASELKSNQAFQDFLNYIRESAPDVLRLIGNITMFLVNMGIAMAPIGAKILGLVNNFLEWINGMMETHSWFSKLMGIIPTVIGGFMALVAPISLLWTLFGKYIVSGIQLAIKAFTSVGGAIARLAPHFALIIDDVLRVIGVVTNLASKALPWLMRGFTLLTGPVGIAIAIITTLITIGVALYKNWDEISAWASKIWGKIKDTISNFMGKIKESIQTKWAEAQDYLKSIDLVQIGKNIIGGLIRGLESVPIVGTVMKIGSSIVGAFEKRMKIKSPSRVMADIAKWVPAGVAKGIKDNLNVVVTAANEMAKKLIPDFSEAQKATKSQIAAMNKALVRGIKDKDSYGALEETAQNLIDLYGMNAAQEADYWKQAASKLKEGSVAKIKALQNYDDAHARATKNQYNREMNLMETARKYGTISLRDQLRMYQQYMNQYKIGSEEQLAYEELIYNTRKQIYDDISKISDNYLKDVQDVYSKLADEEQKLRDEYQKTYDARVDTIANTWGLFDAVNLSDMSEVDLIGNMRGQVQTLSNWMHDLFRLENFGLDEALLEELRDAGPKAAAEISALANMTGAELREYEKLWQTKMSLAGKQATKELSGARNDMESEISSLRENAMKEIEGLRNDMLAEIDEMVNGTNDGFSVLNKTLPEIGKEAIKGLINGLNSMSGELSAAARQLANDATDSLSGILRGGTYNNNFQLATPAVSTSSYLSTDVHSQTELTQSPIAITVNQMWDGESVKTYIDEQDALNAKVTVKKRG